MAGLDLEGEIDLEQLGLPISNTENKLLEAEVQRKQKELAAHQFRIAQHKERIQAVGDHLKNVKQEVQHTQGLLEARKKDVETEEHMNQIADREEGRLKNDIVRLNQEKDELKEKKNAYENEVYRTKQKTEDLKAKMNWEQQALEAWLEESARQDDDAMAIAKYARADEGKIKELSLRMERLHNQMAKKKKLLDNEMIESITAQIELDRTAECFRAAHQEREDLIDQWEQTINQMRKRDEDMEKCTNDLARLQVEITEKENFVREKQEFLDREKENNFEVDKKQKAAERLAAKIRLDYQTCETNRLQVKDELETLKYSVDRSATDLESARGQSAQLTKEIKDKRKKLETLTKQRELMQLELKRTTQKTLSAEENAQKIDQILAQEEHSLGRLLKELSQLKEKQFARAQELFELRRKESSMEAELHGGKATLRNLGSKQHKLDEELLKQQEILYTQDFQLQQLRHRLSRMEGERTGEELEILNEKIKMLEEDWERQQGEEVLVQSQLKRVQEDLRRINRDIAKGLKKKMTLEEKIDEMNLHIDTTQRELRRVVASKQNKMVEENIIKLSVKRLRDHLYAHAGEVQSLEKRKLQLDTAMSERMREIGVHKDMLRAQIKASNTERQTVSAELHGHISKIDKLRKRFEIITIAMNPPEGEEQHSQAYYVIKAAQEREELQRKGDDLDSKIKKAEKEIRAMENTLLLMNSRNSQQRKGLSKVDESGEEMIQLETLEGQWRAAQDKFKHKKRAVNQMESDFQVMGRTLSSLKADESKLASELQEKQTVLATFSEGMDELKAKQDRAALQTTKLVKELQAKRKVCGHDPTHVQRDIQLRELRDFGSNVVQRLGSLSTKNPDLVPTLQLMFSQAGLPPAPSPSSSSRASSQFSSARSSVVSSRSISSRQSATPVIPTAMVDIGGSVSGGSAASTPRQGMSARSSAASLVGGPEQDIPSARSSAASLVGGKEDPAATGRMSAGSKSSLTGTKRSSRPPSIQSSAGSLGQQDAITRASGSKTSLTGGKQTSRPPSTASSRVSSRAGSHASIRSSASGSQKDLDLTIRPASQH